MGCSVHIGREFARVPAAIRKILRARLEKICEVLDKIDSVFRASLAESSLAIRIGSWRFRYEFEASRNRLTVIEALPP